MVSGRLSGDAEEVRNGRAARQGLEKQRSFWRGIPLVSVCIVLCGGIGSTAVELPVQAITGPRESTVPKVIETCAAAWPQRNSTAKAVRVVGSYQCSVARFADDDDPFMALIVRELEDDHATLCLSRRFPEDAPQPKIFSLGQRRIAVVVNGQNRIRSLSREALGSLLTESEKVAGWDAVGGERKSVTAYDEAGDAGFRAFLREKCLAYSEKYPGYTLDSFHTFRDDIQSLPDGDAVIEKVRKDPNGLGLFWYRGQDLKGVKLLEIAVAEGEKPVALVPEPVIQDDYPLAEPLMLYVHPKAPKSLWEFGEFCTGPAAAEIVARHGYMTPHHVRMHEADKRVKRFEDGDGEKFVATGPLFMREIIPALATEYARAREPAQVGFKTATNDAAAVAAFMGDRGTVPELLFLTNAPNEKTLGTHSDAWRKLAPTEHVLAGRATAVIVNAANKLESLSQAHIEAIFAGETNDWDAITGTGLPAPAKKLGPNAIPINRFGTREHDASKILGPRGGKPAKAGRLTLLADTNAVVAAVSLDPQGIGLVNIVDLPRTGQTVRVLGVEGAAAGPGKVPDVVRPTATTIRDESYPYAERLSVFVHPKASKTAKSFAEFLASCGSASSSQEAETVRVMAAAYRKHGWMSLADAAIKLEADDALAEEAVKTAPLKKPK